MGAAQAPEKQPEAPPKRPHNKHRSVEERRRLRHQPVANSATNRQKKKLHVVAAPPPADTKDPEPKVSKPEEEEPTKAQVAAPNGQKESKIKPEKASYVRNWVDRMGRANLCDPQQIAINGYNNNTP